MKPTLAIALCFFFSSTAYAQSFAFELEGFEPVGAPQLNIINVHQSKVLQNEAFALSALFHFSNRPLTAAFDSGEERHWIENQLSASLSANIGLFDFIEFGFSLPLILNRSLNPTVNLFKNSKHTYLSDTRIMGKIQLPLNSLLRNLGVAIVSTFFLPTGNKYYFSGFGLPRFEPRLVLDYRSDAGHIFAINLASQRYETRRFKNLVDEGNVKASAGGEFQITDALSLLATYSATFADQVGSEADAAIRFRRDGWGLTIGGGVGVTSAPGIPDFRVITGFGYSKSESNSDPDGDNIDDDKCPHQAEDLDGFQDHDGCPDLDNDSDGVLDDADDCPLKKGDLKNAGCPLESYFPFLESTPQDLQ